MVRPADPHVRLSVWFLHGDDGAEAEWEEQLHTAFVSIRRPRHLMLYPDENLDRQVIGAVSWLTNNTAMNRSHCAKPTPSRQ